MLWAYTGQKVIFPKAQRQVIFTVVCAAGKAARVVNEEFGADLWTDIEDLEPADVRPEVSSPKGT